VPGHGEPAQPHERVELQSARIQPRSDRREIDHRREMRRGRLDINVPDRSNEIVMHDDWSGSIAAG
jgi:hypothetical protein